VANLDPKVGSEVKRNSLVNIFVSKGMEQVALLSYVGKGGEQALSELTEAGFDVAPAYKFSDTILPGLVISQAPESSASISKGSKVVLNISKGSEFIFVPNVISKTTNQATLDLENQGLKVVVKGKGSKVVSISLNKVQKLKRDQRSLSHSVNTVGFPNVFTPYWCTCSNIWWHGHKIN
jgi:eukaryotic-like serine/threonine-protein kinase